MKKNTVGLFRIISTALICLSACAPIVEGKIRSREFNMTSGDSLLSFYGMFLAVDETGKLIKDDSDGINTCENIFLSPNRTQALSIYACLDISKEPVEECLETVVDVDVDIRSEYAGVKIDEQCTAVKVESRDEIPNEFQPTLGVRANK